MSRKPSSSSRRWQLARSAPHKRTSWRSEPTAGRQGSSSPRSRSNGPLTSTSSVRAFTGSNQLVAEYLTVEVLDGLEPDLRRFLLHTSVLEWLSAELCEAVTGDSNTPELLDELTRRSLFVVHPAGRNERLRYHHLFADLLRYRLRNTEPGEERACRERAAEWLVRRGHLADGIEQLLAAKDPRRVLELVVDRGQELFEREEASTLAALADECPRTGSCSSCHARREPPCRSGGCA